MTFDWELKDFYPSKDDFRYTYMLRAYTEFCHESMWNAGSFAKWADINDNWLQNKDNLLLAVDLIYQDAENLPDQISDHEFMIYVETNEVVQFASERMTLYYLSMTDDAFSVRMEILEEEIQKNRKKRVVKTV